MPVQSSVSTIGQPPKKADVPQDSAPKVMAPKPVQLQVNVEAERQQVQEALAMLNQQVAKNTSGLGFSMDESLGRPVVVVRNTVSGEVIRQIPNEVVVRIARQLDSAKGLFHNKSV
jgi:flagellar protein FlaG